MASSQFGNLIRNKEVKVQFNAPTTDAFDTQNNERDKENMSKFVGDQILRAGRFWKSKMGQWLFDTSTSSQGHPDHVSGSAGYYGISAKKAYIFPKIARSFESFLNDFADSLGLSAPRQKSADSFAEMVLIKNSLLKKYLEKIK